jgi:hypothetical protein
MSHIEITYTGAAFAYNVPPTMVSIPQRAELGETSQGGFSPEDPTAALTLVGHRPIVIEELDCSQPRLFTGWTVERNMGRSFEQTQLAGPDALVHDTSIEDLNAALRFRIITWTDGKRPEESVDARLAWLLTSNYVAGPDGTLFENTGKVQTGFSLLMDECDYRGYYPDDVLADLSTRYSTLINFFLFWDAAPSTGIPRPGLFFDYIGVATLPCTLTISNLIADQTATCFAPVTESRLERTPEAVYSDVIVNYAGGKSIYRIMAATATAFVKRGTSISRPHIGKKATAEAAGDAWLAQHNVETDRITTTIQVPASQVGLIQAGMRMTVKFTNLADYTSDTSMRIVACNPRATDDFARWYDVDLELVSPRLGPQGAFDYHANVSNPLPVLPHATTPGNLLVLVVTSSVMGGPAEVVLQRQGAVTPDYPWTAAGAWQTAYDVAQYGGPGTEVGVGIYWRRVQAGEVTVSPVQSSVPKYALWLWEFEYAGDPGAGAVYTTGAGYLANGGTAEVGAALSGFRIGAFVVQQTSYSWEPQVAAGPGTAEVQSANEYNETDMHRTGWGDFYTFIGTSPSGAVKATVDYTMFDAQVVNHHGVAGAAIELPGWISVPTIPYPANQISGFGGMGGTITGGIVPTISQTQAVTSPTVTDDVDAGYLVGSTWINTATGAEYVLVDNTVGAAVWTITTASSGAPTTADYLVGTAQAGLSAEIVVGTAPGGELGGTWASPTVDATHSGSAHHVAVTLAASADTLLGLTGQALSLDTQAANAVFAGPITGAAAAPGFRALVAADIPTGAGVGAILIIDTPAGSPLVFADLLQNDAGTDLLYADT